VRRRHAAEAAPSADDDRDDDHRALRNDPPAAAAADHAQTQRDRTSHLRMKLHPPGLAGRLALVTALLVTLAVAAVSLFGVRSMQRLAEAEAESHAEVPAAGVRGGRRRSTER